MWILWHIVLLRLISPRAKMPVFILPLIALGMILGGFPAITEAGEPSECSEVFGSSEGTLSIYKTICHEDAKGNVHEIVFF